MNGDTVAVRYVGTLEDGSVFDTNDREAAKAKDVYSAEYDKCDGEDQTQCKYKPLEFTVGGGQMIPGFEKGIIDMKEGEKKTIELEPADAYGEPQQELIQSVPLDVFSGSGINPEVGQTYNFGFAPGKIIEVKEDSITIDFNPPLAGKKLKFEVTIEKITKGTGTTGAVMDDTTKPEADVASGS